MTTTSAPKAYNWSIPKTAQRYLAMWDALLRQNRTIPLLHVLHVQLGLGAYRHLGQQHGSQLAHVGRHPTRVERQIHVGTRAGASLT
ncbi:hypothetical protein B0H67DRAFT_142201 [Lasiosphaeris hirsuta]|uniref:Uncharacterized protein n=1 Tax=Lasiosphaeris hirsuta TaxID=260670 RepID=A0AA40B1J7_9PEZI|nr:hypothetical protein B0H67DRAFT_142201 [Lasiosphaeris hirsuta]